MTTPNLQPRPAQTLRFPPRPQRAVCLFQRSTPDDVQALRDAAFGHPFPDVEAAGPAAGPARRRHA